MSGIRAVIVDDHHLLAQSIAVALGLEGFDCSLADVSDLDAALERVLADPPDVVLLDLELGRPDVDGVSLIPRMVASGSQVVVVTGSTDPVRTGEALEAGAVGVLSKCEPIDVLIRAARTAAEGLPVMPEDARHTVLREAAARRRRRASSLAPFERLTTREGQVLRALAEGHNVSTIARDRHLSEATVRSQVRAVLSKLSVGSQLEAVALAHRTGWLSPSAW